MGGHSEGRRIQTRGSDQVVYELARGVVGRGLARYSALWLAMCPADRATRSDSCMKRAIPPCLYVWGPPPCEKVGQPQYAKEEGWHQFLLRDSL